VNQVNQILRSAAPAWQACFDGAHRLICARSTVKLCQEAGLVKRYSILIAILLVLLVSAPACEATPPGAASVTLGQLFSNPGRYNGHQVTLEAFYFSGFEVNVLSEALDYSGYAEVHLVPKGRMVWVEGGIPKEVYDRLYRQQMMGPAERYGKVKVTGKSQVGGKYGHVGGYDYQIVPSSVELLPWAPSGR